MGEFIEDLQIGKSIADSIGLQPDDKQGPEQNVGADRLGKSDILSRLGVTLLLFSVIIVILAVLVIILRFLCSDRISEKNRHRLLNLRSKLFYNPLIRYAILNSLKLNLTAVTTFQLVASDFVQVSTAVLLFFAINAVPLILSRTLFKSNDELHSM